MIKLDSDVILSKKFLLPAGIIAAAIIILMIIFGFFSGGRSAIEYVHQLNTRATNLSATNQTYSAQLKSSDVLSASSALSSNLAAIISALTPTISSDAYKGLSSSAAKEITTSETELIANLNNTLEQARLNANLDKAYTEQMSAQISDLISLETSTRDATDDDALKSSLDKSISNLTALYNTFNNL